MPKKRIFVADDQEEVLSMLQDLLVAKGFEVKISKDPKEMVKSIKIFQPHLILLDLLMPDLDGFEICQILNNGPETQGIPIIIMSGLSDPVDIKKAYKLGVVDYFTKPFGTDAIVTKIERAIENKEKLL
jgi:PleD family two-component response regulator